MPGGDGKQRERDYRCVFQCLLVQSREEIVNERDNYCEELSGVLCLSGGGHCDTSEGPLCLVKKINSGLDYPQLFTRLILNLFSEKQEEIILF